MTTPYTTGQISLVNGEALVTGIGTGWAMSLIKGGFVFVEADGGSALPILPDDSATTNDHPITDTELTSAIAWTGPTGTFNYAIIRDTAYLQQLTAVAQALADYIQRLNSTTLSAVAGVNAIADTLLLFTGPDTATTIPLSGLINGADYDVQVNNLAGRAIYDNSAANFRVLVSDIGDGRSAIYSKKTNAAADWSAAAIITGATGPAGSGVTPRGVYAPATAYAARDLVQSGGSTWIAKSATTGNAPPVLPTTENTQWLLFAKAGETGVIPRGDYNPVTAYSANNMVLDNGSSWLALQATTGNAPPTLPTTSNAYWRLVAAKGSDGTGTGDVVGPAASVNNRVALFDGATGKLLKDSGIVLGDAAGKNTGTTSGAVAAGDDARLNNNGKLNVEDQVLTGGARITSKDLGAITTGTVTLDPGDRPLQHYTNNGAHTLAPGTNTGSFMLDITNGASAGAITVTGWTKVAGDAFTTTSGNKFRLHCSVGNGGSLLIVQALQ